jgi:alpha-1,3-rhamnosyl/mannosyltransferase
MRILIDGRTAFGTRTGIGWYTYRLAEALSEHAGVEDVGLSVGRGVLSVRQLRESPPPGEGGGRFERLRRTARLTIPLARQAVLAARSLTLRRTCPGWTLFHQPNYVSPRVPIPLVTTVCDLSYLTHPRFMPPDRRSWLERFLPACLRRSRAVVTISEFTRRELLQRVPGVRPESVFVTRLGVDHRRFRPQPDAADESLHRRLGLPPRFALHLGTLEPRKNLQGLLRGYGLLPADLQRDCPLVLAGARGWERQHFGPLLAKLRDAGTVRCLGYVDQADVPALLRAAAAFCFPSHYEGFGLPPLEAAACGTPVLCSDAASLPEVMADAALYIDPNSPEQIADGLTRLLQDDALRDRLRTVGPRRAAAFSWHACAAETLRAYRAAA